MQKVCPKYSQSLVIGIEFCIHYGYSISKSPFRRVNRNERNDKDEIQEIDEKESPLALMNDLLIGV